MNQQLVDVFDVFGNRFVVFGDTLRSQHKTRTLTYEKRLNTGAQHVGTCCLLGDLRQNYTGKILEARHEMTKDTG